MDKYTKHVRLFIRNISHAWFPIAVLEEDKYVVKRLDEAPCMHFPGVLSRTRVTEQQFLSLVPHSLRCLIAKTKIPNGVEDFLNAYSPPSPPLPRDPPQNPLPYTPCLLLYRW